MAEEGLWGRSGLAFGYEAANDMGAKALKKQGYTPVIRGGERNKFRAI